MEAAGLAIGVVGLSALISSCKHLMDQIDSFRHVGSEARPILADFSASKLIFDRWLQNVDVNGDAVQTARGEPVDEKTARVLQDLIFCIRESLKSVEVVVSDFSTSPAEVTQSGDRPVLKKRPTGFSTKTKFQWAFSRKEKAIKEVQSFYRLVQKLHALIPVSGPSGDARSKPALARDPVDELAAHLDKLSERNKAETRRSIDQWLGAKSSESYYEDRLRERQHETCSWIFDRPAFVSWISPEFPDDSAKLLWLHAPPGFGKTILCARIVESLKSSFPDTTALYFFSERQNDSYAILRSWISQIVYQHDEALQTATSNSRIGMTATATHSDMEQMFHSIVQSNSGFTFVVDGLDECEDANETSLDFYDTSRHNFLKTLQRLISNSKTRILVVSRDNLDIRSALCPENDNDKVTVLQIGILKDDVEDDLKAFSKTIVNQRLANRTEELRTELADQMAERADGMFLWVKLHQSGLRGNKSKKRLQEIICSMPQGLHRTYNKNMSLINSLDSVDRSRALFILRWLVVGLTLPTVGQIAVGFAVRMSGQSSELQCDELPEIIDQVYIDEEIINTCAGLVEVKAARPDQPHQYRKLSFIHSSMREYLLQVVPEDTPVIPFSDESFHRGQICEAFLRFLNFDAAWDQRPSSCTTELSLQPFLTVAVRQWIHYFTKDESISEELSTLLNVLFSPNNPHWNRWRDAFDMENLRYGVLWVDDPIWKLWARLNVFILDSPLDELLFECHNRLSNSEIVEMSQRSAQIWQEMIDSSPDLADILEDLKPLFESPVFLEFRRLYPLFGMIAPFDRIRADSSFVQGLPNDRYRPGTRLYHAAGLNHVETLQRIFESEPELLNTIGGLNGTALQSACMFGFESIAEKLITWGADVNLQSGRFGCAINAAAANGHLKLIQKLFQAGAKLDTSDSNGTDALIYAIRGSHKDAAIDLLNLGARADVRYKISNLTGVDELTALLLSATCGQTEVFELLLEKGADISAFDDEGQTCLHLAAEEGVTKLVDIILSRDEGDLLNALNVYGRTPLSYAISNGHTEVFHQLLSAGVKVDAPDKMGLTPLHLAVQHNQRDIVQTLLGLELDINCQDSDEYTPFHGAVLLGHNDLCRGLLNHGADVERANLKKISPLHTAAERNNAELVQVLLDRAVNLLEAKDSDLQTPLVFAVVHGHIQVARLLLERGADVNTRNRVGETPLHVAAQRANTEMIELLLGYGAEISAGDNIGSTPILHAAQFGQLESYKSLLQRGANETKTENPGNSVIHFAVCSGNIEMVRFLIDRGWDVNETNKSMETSVHWAVFSGESEVLAFLLDHGIDTTRLDDRGHSPAHYAASAGQTDCLRVLFDRGLDGDMEFRDDDGYTPLQIAALFGHVGALELILHRFPGIIEDCTDDGWTPLALASSKGHSLVMEALIENGANASALHPDGSTLLQITQDEGHIEAVKVLLKELHKQTSASEPRLNSPSDHRAARSRSLPSSEQREAAPVERTKRSLSR